MPSEDSKSDSRRQIEVLERVNAELAAEIRSLAAGRAERPRSAAVPAARWLAGLVGERDSLTSKLQAAKGRVAELEHSETALRNQTREQQLQIERLSAEVTSLRSGVGGVLRRVRARLLRRRRG